MTVWRASHRRGCLRMLVGVVGRLWVAVTVGGGRSVVRLLLLGSIVRRGEGVGVLTRVGVWRSVVPSWHRTALVVLSRWRCVAHLLRVLGVLRVLWTVGRRRSRSHVLRGLRVVARVSLLRVNSSRISIRRRKRSRNEGRGVAGSGYRCRRSCLRGTVRGEGRQTFALLRRLRFPRSLGLDLLETVGALGERRCYLSEF